MYLILRASDGQALIVYFDEDASISLIRCEYNFRRGRCLGSWERNGKALARISSLMENSPMPPLNMLLGLYQIPAWGMKDDGPTVPMAGCRDKNECIARTNYLRLFLTNASIKVFYNVPMSFDNEFWFSLNMKVTRITNPIEWKGFAKFQEFIDHLKPTQFIHDNFALDAKKEPEESVEFLHSEMVISLEMVHIELNVQVLDLLHVMAAKDLLVHTFDRPATFDWDSLMGFVATRVFAWMKGVYEIDKVQLDIGVNVPDAKLYMQEWIFQISEQLSPEMGWVDQTYEGIELILRASDGQALIFYWDEKNRSMCLIGCEYNFRRGRCIGSYERNGKALARISELMAKSQLLIKRNPGRAVETKEKLRDECIKFNDYNKGARKMDLMTDAIWRPRSQRRFPWALFVKGLHQIFRSPTYPLDSSLNHAYEFTKAFETRARLRPSEFECSILFMTDINPRHTIKFLSDPVICSMEKLHIGRLLGQVKWLDHCRAKDLKIGRNEADHQPVFDFLTRKILKWLDGMAEIEKIQFYDDRRGPAAAIEFETYIRTIPFLVPSHLGWVDRTYEGMYLILRATDGKALLAYYDNAGRSCYLIGCEYNFRRGRCLGSYEQNGKTLRNIRNLMSLSSRLSTQNPKLAADAKEKLKEECIKFNDSDLFGGYGFTTGPHRLQWATLKVDPSSCTPEEARLLYNLNPSAVLIKGCESMEMAIIFSAHLRLLLTNSTVREFYGPEFTYGSQFWKSLHMKAKHVYCLYLTTLEEVKPIFASFQMTGMSCGRLFDPLVPAESIKCLSDPLKLHIGRHLGKVEWLNTLRAKDLKFGRAETDHQPVFDFLRRKIWRWVAGTDEIEKIQFCDDTDLPAASFQFETFIKTIPFLVCSDFGWVDRTYEGMYLILRATDGQALLAHYDPVGRSFYLLRCEYNFRRGRCLGSYQRNVDSLRAIRNLMAISSRLSLKNPKLAGDAKEKLREECSKFNKYNKGATEMDLLTDAIWRPKGERRSIWGMTKNGRFIDDQDLLYPV
ncbi:unnamed protein product, partial [Mesorhabditis spiculigera]